MPITPNKGTQQYKLLKAMQRGRVSSMDAFRQYGITSLHRRLSDLRELGWTIASSWVENKNTGKRFKVYRVVDDGKDVA